MYAYALPSTPAITTPDILPGFLGNVFQTQNVLQHGLVEQRYIPTPHEMNIMPIHRVLKDALNIHPYTGIEYDRFSPPQFSGGHVFMSLGSRIIVSGLCDVTVVIEPKVANQPIVYHAGNVTIAQSEEQTSHTWLRTIEREPWGSSHTIAIALVSVMAGTTMNVLEWKPLAWSLDDTPSAIFGPTVQICAPLRMLSSVYLATSELERKGVSRTLLYSGSFTRTLDVVATNDAGAGLSAELQPVLEGDLLMLHEHPAYAWVAPLDAADRDQMRQEYREAFEAAQSAGDGSQLTYLEADWRATAEALGDPALVSELSADWDPDEAVPLDRP